MRLHRRYRFGVAFTTVAPPQVLDVVSIDKVRLAVAANASEILAIRQIGFDPASVSHVTFNNRAGLPDVTLASARNDANGIVAVVNNAGSPITSGAPDSSFVSVPRYFTAVGDGVRVDQSLAGEGFFLAGHWIG